MTLGRIFKIQKYALHDGPGIRTTVFFKGCPLACRWCHNPEGIAPEVKSGTVEGDRLGGWQTTVRQVLDEIEKDRIFYDQSGGGVTFSGGEPTLQPQFLEELLAGCRQRALHTTLDTCGWAPETCFAQLADQADLVLFDLKLIDPRAHLRHTGADNRMILKNFRVLTASGKPLRVRVPLVPGITDTEENIMALSGFLHTCGCTAPLDLLPFHATAEMKYQRLGMPNPMAGVTTSTPEVVARVREHLNREGFTITIGG
jgi:pyruvate formate lyase activating enzyme